MLYFLNIYINQIQNGLFTAFRNSAETCQVIVKSDLLKDAILELNEVTGAVAVCVALDKNKGMMVSIKLCVYVCVCVCVCVCLCLCVCVALDRNKGMMVCTDLYVHRKIKRMFFRIKLLHSFSVFFFHCNLCYYDIYFHFLLILLIFIYLKYLISLTFFHFFLHFVTFFALNLQLSTSGNMGICEINFPR